MIEAADNEDQIEAEKLDPVDMKELKTAIVKMVKKGCAPMKFWSVYIIEQWCQSKRQGIKGTAKEKRDAIHELLSENVLIKKEIDLKIIGKQGTATETILDETKGKDLKYLD